MNYFLNTLTLIGNFVLPSFETYQSFPNLGLIVVAENFSEKILLNDSDRFFGHPRFNSSLPTVLIANGYTCKFFNDPAADLMVRSYRARGNVNLIFLDWFDYNVGDYLIVRKRVSIIGRMFGETLCKLSQNGLINLDTWHLVGISLGTHLAGNIGRTIRKVSNGKVSIQRITGLGPPGIAIYDPISYFIVKPLQPSDGEKDQKSKE